MSSWTTRRAVPHFTSTRRASEASPRYAPPESRPFPHATTDVIIPCQLDSSGFSSDPESTGGYGYQVWRCTPDGAWRADGKYGQFSVVLPEQRAVVTVTAHNEVVANDILRAVWDTVLPRL